MDQASLRAMALKYGTQQDAVKDSPEAQPTFVFDIESLAALLAEAQRTTGWLSVKEHLPRPMSGYVATLHPQKEEPRLEFVGTRSGDFREDGYTHFFAVPAVPETHRVARRNARRAANLKTESHTTN